VGIAFTEGRVFIGNGQVLDNASVYIEDSRIVSVQEGTADFPSGTREIPIGDGTLFPGFIDCHVHLVMDASPDPMKSLAGEKVPATTIKAVEHARKTLAGGVTTVRDLGANASIDLCVREAVASGLIKGPRILAAAQLICMTGGHGWTMGREADGPDEVRRAAREQIKAGADVLKFMATGGVLTAAVEPGSAQLTFAELEAGIAEAHKAGRKTATHAMGSQGIMDAILAGIDTIEHGIYLTDEIIALMIEKGVHLIPTISAMYQIGEKGVAGGIPAFAVAKNEIVVPHHKRNVKKAYEAGVSIAMGTDSGTPFNFHGSNLGEIPLLVRYGLSPLDAILAATGRAAEVLGLENQIGTVEAGKLADLVLIAGNPLADIDMFTSRDIVQVVMKDGEICA